MFKFKRVVLWGSLLGVLLLFILFNTKKLGVCEIYCGSAIDKYQNIFLFFPFILFFSILTFKMKDSVFTAWWKFARIAIPVIFLVSLYINLKSNPNGGGWFSVEDQVNLIELVILYVVFVVGSAIQVYRGYKN